MSWLPDLAVRLHEVAEGLRALEPSLMQIALFIIFASGLFNLMRRL